MAHKRVIFNLLVIAGMIAACFFGCGKGEVSITMAGSTAFQPFAEKLAEQFMTNHPGINITVQGGGSALGVQSALSGAAEIGMADLVELPEEANSLKSVVVARDGIAIIVHPSNNVSNLTTQQVRDIFNGAIRNWKELGGEDKPITVVSREAGSGTRDSFETIIKEITLANDAIIQDSNGTIRETVANDPNAIGYLSHGLLNDKIKDVKLDGYSSTCDNILSGKYVLVRPVYLLTKDSTQNNIKEFIDYLLSAEGQKIIKENGLIPAL